MRTLSVAFIAMACVSACASFPDGREQSTSSQATSRQANPPYSEVAKISDLKDVASYARKFPRERTLVVFDIDDTLLTTPSIGKDERKFFGSDRWYLWQYYGLPATSQDKIGKCLFEVIAENAKSADQEETQADAMEILAEIPNDKLMLTSRGTSMKVATDMQLASVGYVGIPSLNPKGGSLSITVDGTVGVYDNGVFLTQGANKGKALVALLEATGRDYDYVILVDDTEKNVLNMAISMALQRVGYVGLRYTTVKNDPPLEVTVAQIEAHRRDWQGFLTRHPDKKEKWITGNCK